MLKNDAIKLCQENNFNSGFFEGSDNNTVVDAYELKVSEFKLLSIILSEFIHRRCIFKLIIYFINFQIRLEHILERIALISEAANTERPSTITNYLFIGGVLSARSICTMQHLGITHILCLCTDEIGQSDSQPPDLFTYKNFFVSLLIIFLCFNCPRIILLMYLQRFLHENWLTILMSLYYLFILFHIELI